MSYGDFTAQVRQRGATDVTRVTGTKSMELTYQGKLWRCDERQVREMTRELADGYEMDYCLSRYCEKSLPE